MVAKLLLGAGQGAQCLRQRKGQHEVGHREQQFLLGCQLGRGLVILAGGAVSVPTRVVAVNHFMTVRTCIDLTTQRGRTAAFNRPHGRQFGYGSCAAKRLMALIVGAAVALVRWV